MAQSNPDRPKNNRPLPDQKEIAIDISFEELDAFEETQKKKTLIEEQYGDLHDDEKAVLKRKMEKQPGVLNNADGAFRELEEHADKPETKREVTRDPSEESVREGEGGTHPIVRNADAAFQELDVVRKREETLRNRPDASSSTGREETSKSTPDNEMVLPEKDIDLDDFAKYDHTNLARNRTQEIQKETGKSAPEAAETAKKEDDAERKDGVAGVTHNDSEKEVQEKREKFEEALGKASQCLGCDPKKDAIAQIQEKLNEDEVNGTKENEARVLEALQEQYSPEEAKNVLARMRSDKSVALTERIKVYDFFGKVAEKKGEKALDEMLAQKDIGAYIREKAQGGDSLFKEFVEEQEKSAKLRMEAQKAAEEQSREQEQALRQETGRILSDLGVTGSLTTLPPEWNGALRKIEEQEGDKTAAREFFRNAPRLVYGTLSAQVRGAEMELSSSGKFSLIGHHAGDRASARPYELRDASSQEFDDKYTWSMADQDGHSLAVHSPDLRSALALFVAGSDSADSSLMTEKQANRFHNFNEILFGGNTEKKTESQRLVELGIDPANPDQRALFDLGLGLRYWLPSSSEEEYKKEGGYVVGYEDVVTFMRLRSERGLQLPSLEELKSMTEKRLNGKEEWWKERERDSDHTGGA